MECKFLLIMAAIILSGCDTTEKEASSESTTNLGSISASRAWSGLSSEGQAYVNTQIAVLQAMDVIDHGILFLGDSIFAAAPLEKMFPEVATANYGIAWDTTDGVLLRLEQVARNRPERLFLLIGTNDLNYEHNAEYIAVNIRQIIDQLATALTTTDFYVISILPREESKSSIIIELNKRLIGQADESGYTYVDLHNHLKTEYGTLNSKFTNDGLHPDEVGYDTLREILRKCVYQGCPSG